MFQFKGHQMGKFSLTLGQASFLFYSGLQLLDEAYSHSEGNLLYSDY